MKDKEKESKPPGGHSLPPQEVVLAHAEDGGDVPPPAKFVITWVVIAVLAGVAVWLLPTPDGLSERGHAFLALLLTILILWTSEAVSIGITAMLVGASLVLFEIQPLARAWQTYAHQTVVFVFTIIMLGVIIAQTTLPQRILSGVLKMGGRQVKRLSFTLCMSACFLSAWAHDAAITIILLFAFLPLFHKMGITPQKTNNFAKHFIFVITLGAASGGGGTFIGSGRSPVSAELFGTMTGYHIGFMEYALYQFVPSMIYGLGTWIAV